MRNVFAPNYETAKAWADQNQLKPFTWTYINAPDRARGLPNATIISSTHYDVDQKILLETVFRQAVVGIVDLQIVKLDRVSTDAI